MPTPFPGAIVPAVPYPLPVPLPVLGAGMVTVSFDQGWLPYIIGALKVFTAESTWDPPTQAEVNATIKAAYDLFDLLMQAKPFVPPQPTAPFSGNLEDDMPLLRQNPSNLCQLQVQCADGTWDTVFDASLCKPNPAPGTGTTPPVGGQCTTYKMASNANAVTPLPFLVNTGDTIQLLSALGAGTDGTLDWFCPDGSLFIAGACAGGGHTSGADPLPTAFHMSLLLQIGVNYYPFSTAPFTVPGGVSNLPVYVLVNDVSLADDSGSYQLQFTFCNNQPPPAGTWCHHSDFVHTPDGWTPPIQVLTGACGTPTQAAGVWLGGTGWKGSHLTDLGCVNTLSEAIIVLDMGAPASITAASITGSMPTAVGGSQVAVVVSTTPDFSAGNTTLILTSPAPGGTSTQVFSGGPVTARYVKIFNYWEPGVVSASDLTITSFQISGTGTAPPIGSNC